MHAIPTIDIRPLREGSGAERREAAARIGLAAQDYGFMKLVGHGLPSVVVDETFAAARDFFALPEAAKLPCQERQTNRGFQPMFDNIGSNGTPSGQEAFSMGHPHPPQDARLRALPFYADTPWPDLPGFRERLLACYEALFALGELTLSGFALHLGLAEDFFAQVSRNTYSNMRVIHYPPHEQVAHLAEHGVRPHEDQGLITLLIQDMNGGLDVLGPDGDWLPVEPDPEAVVINVGKLLTRWTNGRLKSAMHRVINRSGRERYSIPLFFHPNFHQRIDPRDFAGDAPLRYEAIVAGPEVYNNFARERTSWAPLAQALATGAVPGAAQAA